MFSKAKPCVFRGLRKGNNFVYGGNERTNIREPAMSGEEFDAHDHMEGVRVERLPFESVIAGFHITDDQAIEWRRLGIRQDLALTMERKGQKDDKGKVRDAGKQILDERINERLRAVAAKEISVIKLQNGVFKKAGHGVWSFVKDTIPGIFSDKYDEVGTRVRDIYGKNEQHETRRVHIADQVIKEFVKNAADETALENALVTAGVPIPSPYKVPKGSTPLAFHLSEANYDQLLKIQESCKAFIPPRYQPRLFPGTEPVPAANIFEQLVQLVSIEAQERMKMLTTTIFDTKNLQQFLDKLKKDEPDTFKLLSDILVENGLYAIQNIDKDKEKKNVEAQALVAYLMHRRHNPAKPTLKEELEGIKGEVKSKAAMEKDKAAATTQKETIITAQTTILTNYNQLMLDYGEALSLGSSIVDAKESLKGFTLHSEDDSARTALVNSISQMQADKRKLMRTINIAERLYLDAARKYTTALNNVKTIDGTTPKLKAFNSALPSIKPTNDEADIFGDLTVAKWAAPPFKTGTVKDYLSTKISQSDFEDISSETKKIYIDELDKKINVPEQKEEKKTERVTPRQLLYLLKEKDMERSGITNPEQARMHALLSTNIMIVDAKHQQLYRSTNLEIAQRLGGTTLGSVTLDRMRKAAIARMTNDRIYVARDVIDYVSGFDKEFRMFHGMPQDITLAELRDRIIEHGGISDAKLYEFALKMEEIFKSFEILSTKDKVELFDKDAMDMEELIRKMLILREEVRAREFFAQVRGMEGDKAQIALKKIVEDEVARNKDEESLTESIKNRWAKWKEWFARKILKKEFGPKLQTELDKQRTEKVGGHEAEDRIWEQGLKTVAVTLGTEFAISHAIKTGRKLANGAYQVLKPKSKAKIAKERKGIFNMAGKIMGGTWRGVKKGFNWVADFGASKPGKGGGGSTSGGHGGGGHH